MPKKLFFCGLLISISVYLAPINFEGASATSEQEKMGLWDLSDIYKSWEDWELGVKELIKIGQSIEELIKKPITTPEDLLAILTRGYQDYSALSQKLKFYTWMRYYENTNDAQSRDNYNRALGYENKWDPAIDSLITKIPEENVKHWITQFPKLKPFQYKLSELYRKSSHSPNPAQMEIYKAYEAQRNSLSSIYNTLALANTDLKYPRIKLSSGEEMEINSANLGKILYYSPSQDRKAAIDAFSNIYNTNCNTYAAILSMTLKNNLTLAKLKNHKSVLASALFEENLPMVVFENLMLAGRENAHYINSYSRLIARYAKLDSVHCWILFGWTFYFLKNNLQLIYPYNQSPKLILESLRLLGKDYSMKINSFFAKNWIDVYPRAGKINYGMTFGAYGINPKIILNYTQDSFSVSNLIHESGHAIHHMLINKNLPACHYWPSQIICETAAALNQLLLMDYFISHAKNSTEKIRFLNYKISSIMSIFNSTLHSANLEFQLYRLIEEGKPIDARVINRLFLSTFKDFNGDDPLCFDGIENGWQLYSQLFNFQYYNYQYALSLAVSLNILNKISTGPKKIRKKNLAGYFNLLQAGGSDSPVNLLKKAGIDITRPDYLKPVAEELNRLIMLMEDALKNYKPAN